MVTMMWIIMMKKKTLAKKMQIKKTLLHMTLMGLWGMIAERGRTPAPIVSVHLKIKELQAAIRDYEENL